MLHAEGFAPSLRKPLTLQQYRDDRGVELLEARSVNHHRTFRQALESLGQHGACIARFLHRDGGGQQQHVVVP